MAGNGKWTDEEIRDLGATTDLQTLAGIFGCSVWMSRKMARTGEWERQGIKIFRIGVFYRVGVPSILDVLGFSSPGSSSPETGPEDELAAADDLSAASECLRGVIQFPGESPVLHLHALTDRLSREGDGGA
ncbi:MAG: hypothetical protein ACRDRJ_39595 [Streptosporangiaceae bacterium]